jgi:hypothetical protein
MSGQVLLQRRYRTSNLELISVWSSPEALEERLASGSAQARSSRDSSPRSTSVATACSPADGRPRRLPATPLALRHCM